MERRVPPTPKYLPPGRTIPSESTIDYFASHAVPQEVMSHVGEFFGNSPIVAAARKLKQSQKHSTNGLGQTEVSLDGVSVAVVAAAVFLGGVALYQTGKAMAPNRKSEVTWGWTAVPVGLLFNIWGLGVMGAVSNTKK